IHALIGTDQGAPAAAYTQALVNLDLALDLRLLFQLQRLTLNANRLLRTEGDAQPAVVAQLLVHQQLLIRHQIAGILLLLPLIHQEEGLAEFGAPAAEVALLLIYADLPIDPLPERSKILPIPVKGHLDRFCRAD